MKNNKHDHKLTKFLKATIFSIVMLAPFIAVGVKCLYVIKNENAKESYSGEFSYQGVGNIDYSNPNIHLRYYQNDYISNNIYGAESDRITTIKIYNDTNDNYFFDSTSNTYSSYTTFKITMTTGWRTIYGYDQSDTLIRLMDVNVPNYNLYISEIIINENTTFNSNWKNSILLHYDSYFVDTTLSSVFYSAIQELDKASIFSWTTNTAIYSAVSATTEGLGIVSPPLAILITYWSIITAIYIIFDIVIEMFIFLTHWANDKMA